MRRIRLLAVLMLLALAVSTGPEVAMAGDPPPKSPEDLEGLMRNRMGPNYVYTPEEL